MSWFHAPTPLLPDLIAQNGRWLADRPALVDGAATLTWREFAAATARVANGLAALGIRPRERVAVLMESRLETVLALFGIVRAGAVAVPLNVSMNDAAVAAMCADAGCVAVFASGLSAFASMRCVPPARSAPAVHRLRLAGRGLARLPGLHRGPGRERPAVPIAPNDECNMIYSSGTTALPKASCTRTRAECSGRTMPRSRFAIVAAAALSSRSGCSRTSVGSPCWRRCSSAARSCCCARSAPATCLRSSRPSASRTAPSFPCSSSGCWRARSGARFAPEPCETLMCCGSPLAADVKRGFAREFDCQLIELYGLTEGLMTILEPEELERKSARSASRCLAQTFAFSARTTASWRWARQARSSAAVG